MDVAELLLLFTGSSAGATRAIAEVNGGLTEVEARAGKAHGGLMNIGNAVTAVAAVAVAVVGVGIVTGEMAAKFEQEMTLIQTQAGASAEEVKKMSKAVLDLSGSVAVGPEELAKGLYHLESLGYRGQRALDALTVAAKASQIGGANLEQTTSALGAAMVTGIRGTENLTTTMGLLDATVGNGNMRMEEMVSGLSTGVLPVFKNAGLSLQDYGAALATLTDNGMHADEASTRLRMTVALMAAPSGAAAKALKSIGLEATDLGVTMREKGLVAGLQQVKDHLEKTFGPNSISDLKQYVDVLNTQGPEAADRFAQASGKSVMAVVHAFGGGRSSAAIQTLISQIDRVQTKFTAIGEQAGQFDDKFAARSQNVTFKVDQMKASFERAGITVGQQFAPMIGLAADLGTRFFNDIATGRGPVVELAQTLMTLGQRAMGAIMTVREAWTGFTSDLRNGASMRTAIVGVLATFGLHLDDIRKIAGPLAAVASAIREAGESAMRSAKWIGDFIGFFRDGWVPVSAMEKAFHNLGLSWEESDKRAQGIAKVFDTLHRIWMAMAAAAKVITDEIAQKWNREVWPKLQENLTKLGPLWKEMQQLWESAKPVLAVLAVLIGTLLSIAFHVIVDVIGNSVGPILSFLIDTFGLVIDIVRLVCDVITGKWDKAGGDIVGIIQHLAGMVISLFKFIDGVGRGIIEGFVMGIVHFFQWLFDMIVGHSIIPDLVNGIISWFAKLPGEIANWLGNVVGAVERWAGDLERSAVSAGTRFAAGITGEIKKLVGEFTTIAGQMVDGLVNGIAGGAGKAAQAVTGFIGGLLDAGKKAAGIQSPSRLFAEKVGAPIAEGIGMGIGKDQSAEAMMRSKLTNLAKVGGSAVAIRGSFAGVAAGAGSAGRGGTNVTINNPASEIDVMSALKRADYLARMEARGVRPAPVAVRAIA